MQARRSVAGPPKKRKRAGPEQSEQLDHASSGEAGEDEGPACQSCRSRKAKCSRRQPCSQCDRLNVDCIYDERRTRPGMKTGAIESLNRRLARLEQMFLGQGLLLKPLLDRAASMASNSLTSPIGAAALGEQVDQLENRYLSAVPTEDVSGDIQQPDADPRANAPALSDLEAVATNPSMPPENVVDDLVEWYFDNVHRWIPILHVQRFRERLRDPIERSGLSSILHAITSLGLRFNQDSRMTEAEKRTMSLRCRHAVILQSMERFSFESLQALVIIAFDIIGSGRGPSAWSVVGSMTRTVEHLRLSTEGGHDAAPRDPHEYLLRRMSFLRQARGWKEEEERRRVFWSVFVMDRFCSIATGWNNSLTGADVRRRLPCEGAIWEAGTPVKTPFFGIAERSSQSQKALTPTSERRAADDEEVEAIGGFAFFIEATESLNLVTSFFLQNAVNFKDPQEVQMWLMRFKELDLRLVKWRLFLPPKWHNASVLNQDGIMDPNLTLAHITHNTAVIQLHQCVAYPSTQWPTCPVNLPSASSAETCTVAACEIGTIAQQFLQQSGGITNPQLSFCLFVAGRVLLGNRILLGNALLNMLIVRLAHARATAAPLHAAFDTLSASLLEIADRWTRPCSPGPTAPHEGNLASRLSKRLDEARATLYDTDAPSGVSRNLDIRQPVYSDEVDVSRASSVGPRPTNDRPEPSISRLIAPQVHNGCSPESISMAFPPLPLSFDYFMDPSTTQNGVQKSTTYDGYGDDPFSAVFDQNGQQASQSHVSERTTTDSFKLLRVSTYMDQNQQYSTSENGTRGY